MSFTSRAMNARSAASFGQRVFNTRSVSVGTNNAAGCDASGILGSVTGGSDGAGGGGGGGGGGGRGGLASRYINYMAAIIALIINVRNTSIEDLQTALTTLVGFQQLLGNFYSIAVDPTANNYDTILYQITHLDAFIYFLFFAYNLCDYQIIQYELTTAINNSQKRYLNLLNAKADTNQGYSQTKAVNLTINTGIKNEYLNYLQFYGLPNKGLFIPSILERIRLGIININNYQLFDPMTLNIVDPAQEEWVDTGSIDPIVGNNETVTTTVNDTTGQTTTTIIDTDNNGNVLANITIVV